MHELLFFRRSPVIRRPFSMVCRQFQLSTAATRSKSTPAASRPSSNRKARVVVVGSGRMGCIRASLIRANPRFEFVGVVDPNLEAAEALGAKYGVEHFESLDEAVEKSSTSQEKAKLHGIVISTPTCTHASIIRNAADHKISVFTEKPVDETAEQIQDTFEYADAAGIALCCSFQRRFDPTYVSVTQSVQSGVIGKAVMASIFFADHPIAPRQFLLKGGNIFMDLSAHDVDYITHTLNDDVVSVYASGTSSDPELAAAGIHDNATMVMNMQKGAVVTLFMSRSASYGYDQRCEIFGDKGLVSVGNPQEHAAILSTVHGIQLSRLQHSFPQRFEKAFALELDAFCNVLLQETTNGMSSGVVSWPVTAEQCIRVQKVADAARLSCETGEVVRI